jgi:hypothetical protein
VHNTVEHWRRRSWITRDPSSIPGCKHPVYTVETDGQAQQQINARPAAALAAYTSCGWCWRPHRGGQPYHRDNPRGALRSHTFGTSSLAVYLIFDDQRRVDVLLVQWVDFSAPDSG